MIIGNSFYTRLRRPSPDLSACRSSFFHYCLLFFFIFHPRPALVFHTSFLSHPISVRLSTTRSQSACIYGGAGGARSRWGAVLAKVPRSHSCTCAFFGIRNRVRGRRLVRSGWIAVLISGAAATACYTLVLFPPAEHFSPCSSDRRVHSQRKPI